MKCHSLSVVCHSLWWPSNREAATRAHLIPGLLSGFSLIPSTFYLSHTHQSFSSFYSVPVLISFLSVKEGRKRGVNFFLCLSLSVLAAITTRACLASLFSSLSPSSCLFRPFPYSEFRRYPRNTDGCHSQSSTDSRPLSVCFLASLVHISI